MERSARTRIVAALAAGGLLLGAAACSDDDSSDTSTGDEVTTTTVATTEASDDTMMEEMAATVVDVAAGNEDFSTLVELVTAADLVETLSGDGPFTVFAPTNDAFAAVPADVMDGLGADTAALTTVLTYHVVPGKVLSSDLSDGQEVTTVEGTTFTVNIAASGDVTLTDGAGQEITVSAVDLEAENGVVHVIDGVLLPGDPAALLGG